MPFTLVYGDNLSAFPDLRDQMLCDRGTQFIEDLGWELTTDDQGRELDEYDSCNPLYLILSDDKGDHAASTRLMPTTGPNMTADHFAHLTDNVAISSAVIWETTRFFVTRKAERKAAPALMWAGCEIALRAGVEFYLGVIGSHMERVFTACGWKPEVIGRSGEGAEGISACLWEVSPEISDRLARRAGIRLGENDLRIHRQEPMPKAVSRIAIAA